MAWLLDTNILSELRRSKPERKVLAFIESLALDQMYVSVATLAELVTDAPRRADLNDWLTNVIRPMFDQRVIPITEDSWLSGGFSLKRVGRLATLFLSQTLSSPLPPLITE